ncbi:hypothetical protein DITRI_Ditri09bG0049800 [Diplodiscus trichospermus]
MSIVRGNGAFTGLKKQSRSSCKTLEVSFRLYIEQPQSSTSVSGHDEEAEWAEYKKKETNMFTVDKYQQIGLFFPKERAFSLRYQTDGMFSDCWSVLLNYVQMILPQGLCYFDVVVIIIWGVGSHMSCLSTTISGPYLAASISFARFASQPVCSVPGCGLLGQSEKDRRARAFHIMDPSGFVDMLLIFLEDRGWRGLDFTISWQVEGHSVTKHSGVYGSMVAEADAVALLEMDYKNKLIQPPSPVYSPLVCHCEAPIAALPVRSPLRHSAMHSFNPSLFLMR